MRQNVYDPEISIKVYKVSARTEVAENIKAHKRLEKNSEYQLDVPMGDGCSCRIAKGVKQPAGTFDITITDRAISAEQFESFYGVIEPMDAIEIRMAHSPVSNGEKKLPVVMRGFVSELRRSEGIDESGQPTKTVHISGHDYGKVFQIFRIIKNGFASETVPDISGFSYAYILGKETGVKEAELANNFQVNDFIENHMVKAAQVAFLDKIPWGNPKTRPFKQLKTKATATGTVSYFVLQAMPDNASLWDHINQTCDVNLGFNEFFTVDEEDDVLVVFRPTPYIKPDGSLIEPSDAKKDWFPEEITVTENDIISITSSRSDAKVANFFQCRINSYELQEEQQVLTASPPELLKDYQNCAKERYGVRQFTVQTKLLSDAGPKDNDQNETWRKWHLDIMRAISKDAVLFESGSIRLKGNEKIKAGGYLKVKRRNFEYKVYVESVEHDFQMYNGFFTNVRYTNGTAFIVRSQKDKPYLDEMSTTDAYGSSENPVPSVPVPDAPPVPVPEAPAKVQPVKNPAEWIVDEEDS